MTYTFIIIISIGNRLSQFKNRAAYQCNLCNNIFIHVYINDKNKIRSKLFVIEGIVMLSKQIN